MLTFEALDAAQGDALILHWDSHRMVVDGGPSSRYLTRFKPALQRLGGPVDVLCVSHVDGDHIGGVERYLDDLREGVAGLPEIGTLWFNSIVDELLQALAASHSAVSAVVASVNQGRHVRDAARFLGLDGNAPFGGLITRGMEETVEGLRVRVLGPSRERLDALQRKWEATPPERPEAVVASYTDPSVPNLASIVLLVERSGRSLLLTGDARGDHVLDGIAAARLPDPLRVDVLKLPHHGSDNNMERGFFDRVVADHYVVSANGTYGHPSLDVLDWLVDSRGTDEYTIHLTNDVPGVAAHLASLRPGRRFDVNVRTDPAPSIRIDLP